MEADDVVLEYLRGKLKGARGSRAERIMKPKVDGPSESDEMSPEDLAELESMVGDTGSASMRPDIDRDPQASMAKDDEPCATCGLRGGCGCEKGE